MRPSGTYYARQDASEGPRAFVTKRPFVGLHGVSASRRVQENLLATGIELSARGIYKGYTFADVSTLTESGQYRARVAIMALDGARTRSQRFIDLEVFRTSIEANERVVTVAKTWIDENEDDDKLALPTNFSVFD